MNYPLYVAVILFVGLLGGKIASKFKLPSVTGYIIFGLLLGPSFTNIITKDVLKSMQFVNHLALGILALSVGAELHLGMFKKYGKSLFFVSIGSGIFTFSLTTILTYLLGLDIKLSLVLGVLAMTVSPSGVFSIIKEYRASGVFANNVLALVAIENLLCIVTFGIITAIFQGLQSTNSSGAMLILTVVIEILFAVILGALTGITTSYAIKKRFNNNKFLVFLLAIILLNTGLAIQYNLSALLLNITTGAVVVNLTNKKITLSSTLERVELPVFVLFLTLAGAKLDLSVISSVGLVGIGYIAGRLLGKIGGSFIGSTFTDLETNIQKNIGMALTPQAGVAIGLSVIAEQKLPHSAGIITAILLSGIIFFEIVGPLLLKRSLKNTGCMEYTELNKAS
jgi:Kef-type K+ transport system membrane component KefB